MTTSCVNSSRHGVRLLCLCAVVLTLAFLSAPRASGQTIAQRLTDIVNRLQTLQSNVTNTLNQARDAALQTDALPGMIARVQEVYDSVDGPGRDMIESYVVMLSNLIQQQREGFEAFVTPGAGGVTPASAFRTRLTSLLSDLSGLTNDLMAFDDTLRFELRLDVVNRLIAILPDGLLYPFHVIMARSINLLDSGLVALIPELRAALPDARDFLNGASSSGVMSASRPDAASQITAQVRYVQLEANGRFLKVSGFTITAVGKTFSALTELDEKEAKVGIHGYVGLHGKFNPGKTIAGLLEVVGEILSKIGERVESKLNDEQAQSRHDQIIDGQTTMTSSLSLLAAGQVSLSADQVALMDRQQQIIDGQAQILGALSRIAPRAFPNFASVPPSASLPVGTDARRVQVEPGAPVALSAGPVASAHATYQWFKDGEAIEGAVFPAFTIPEAADEHFGTYRVVVTDETGSRTSAPAVVSLIPGRVLNVSVRFAVPDQRPMIAGFVLDSAKAVVVRGVGQSLSAFGIPIETTMADPVIEIYNGDGHLVASNDNYLPSPEVDAAMADVGAFPLTSSTDAVVVADLPAGPYTVHLRSRNPDGGDCIVEVYDTDPD